MQAQKANFRLFAANGNAEQKFVFLGRQTINGNRRLLFQQTPSMSVCYVVPLLVCNKEEKLGVLTVSSSEVRKEKEGRGELRGERYRYPELQRENGK
jgi:hypothetical protein